MASPAAAGARAASPPERRAVPPPPRAQAPVRMPSGAAAEERVVLDIGSRVCRAGFSGDAAPQVVMDAQRPRHDATPGTLWGLSFLRADDARKPDERYADLVRALARVIRHAYQDHLLVDPRTCKVTVVHSPLLMDAVREAFCDVLLSRMGAPSVSFIDAHVLALFGLGRTTGIVVDCGHLETCAMPVYDGRALRHLCTTTPRAGERVSDVLAALLAAQQTGACVSLTPTHVEAVKTAALVVGPMPPAPAVRAAGLPVDAAAFADAYSASCSAVDLAYAPGGIVVPGWVRERACEALFEDGDEDEKSIVECAVHSIVHAPIDVRCALQESVVLIGGTAMIPGFAPRFAAQLQAKLAQRPAMDASKPPVVRVASTDASTPCIPPNILAWVGGSVAGTLHADAVQPVLRDAWRAG
ncbi:hypothetical protein MSPP1_003964 [Malassezia sp. CBS 17886]|nr:hypothetical protein MSPP1_003964 [Malassezia sp. CBS 17886]